MNSVRQIPSRRFAAAAVLALLLTLLAGGDRQACAADAGTTSIAAEGETSWLVQSSVSEGRTTFQFSWLVTVGICMIGAVPIVLGGFLIAAGGNTRSAATHVGGWIVAVASLLLLVFVPEALTERVTIAKDRFTATTGWWFWRDRVTVKFDDLHSFELKAETRTNRAGREVTAEVFVCRLFSGDWTRIDSGILLRNAVGTIRNRANDESATGAGTGTGNTLEFAKLGDASWSNLSLEEYSALIRVKPNDPKPYIDRGRAYGKRGLYQRAIDDFSAALRLRPQNWLALLGRGLARFELGDYQSAIRDFTEVTRLKSTDVRGYLGRGLAYAELRQFAPAEADFSEVLKAQPNDTFTLTHRGQARVRQAKHVDAMSDFRSVVRLAPNEPAGYRELAWLWSTCPEAEFRHGERALQYAIRACEQTHWQDADSLDALACAHAECGHFDAASEWAEKALALAAVSHPERLREHLAVFRAKQPVR
ncbi:MAG: tetratricopeptide repeat protein [Planctomycetales bacterium]|nr:tetratricopeptide repeat protein [Planctomycetales bacterium]